MVSSNGSAIGGKVTRPRSLAHLVEAMATDPDATLVAGGTDIMVDVNAGRLRPTGLIDLWTVPELRGWRRRDGYMRIGSMTTFGQIERGLLELAPGLAAAARTVGSPQIRSRATIGGNLGTASPAGDALPMLVAAGAMVELVSVGGVRRIPIREYLLGPRRTQRREDECVLGVETPIARHGTEQFLKVGVRNSMVIAVASVALHLDPSAGRVGVGLGSVAPHALAADQAEEYAAELLASSSRTPAAIERFGQLVAEAAAPIDDHRGTARYRRHVVAVLAVRAFTRILEEA